MRRLTPFWYSVVHGTISLLAFGLPLILNQFHQYTDLTIGTVLVAFVNWLEHRLQ